MTTKKESPAGRLGQNTFAGRGQDKYNQFSVEKTAVKEYLTNHIATATMVAVALDIYRPNLCRYKSMLQEEGVLVVTHNGICKETGFPADYLSCDPEIVNVVKGRTRL